MAVENELFSMVGDEVNGCGVSYAEWISSEDSDYLRGGRQLCFTFLFRYCSMMSSRVVADILLTKLVVL